MKINKSGLQVNIGQQTPLKDWDKYKGSIVMTVDDRVYATTQPGKIPQMLKEIEKKHHKKPLITVVPKGDTLILNDYIPPLLGRQEFFESFKVTFEKLVVTFE